MPPPPSPPHVFWLFGLSGAGKTTLAGLLAKELRMRNIPVLALDGDTVRSGLCQGLGFSDADRAENLRRSAEASKLALASGLSVVAAFITPLESHRRLVAGVIGRDHLSLIHLDTPLEICRQRDVKGLYAGAETGKVAHMTGFTSAFELPRQSDLILHPGREPVQASTASLLEFALRKLGVTSAA